MTNKIVLNNLKLQWKQIKSEVLNRLQDVLENTAYISGKQVAEFEERFASMHGFKHCIAMSSGTDALIVAKMISKRIFSGTKIYYPINTYIATIEPWLDSVDTRLVGVDYDNYRNMDVKLLPNDEHTGIILPVHLYGNPADVDLLNTKEYRGFVIEDCSQAHFATLNKQFVGTFGDLATFSFYPGKNLGAIGEAGALCTDNAYYAYLARMFSSHGMRSKYDHQTIGYNFRMSEIQAAALNVKLNYILAWTKQRQEIGLLYTTLLKSISSIKCPLVKENREHVYHQYVIDLTSAQRRDELQDYLKEHNVDTGIHYPTLLPAHKHVKRMTEAVLSNNKRPFIENSNPILSLPIYPDLTQREVETVASYIGDWESTL